MPGPKRPAVRKAGIPFNRRKTDKFPYSKSCLRAEPARGFVKSVFLGLNARETKRMASVFSSPHMTLGERFFAAKAVLEDARARLGEPNSLKSLKKQEYLVAGKIGLMDTLFNAWKASNPDKPYRRRY